MNMPALVSFHDAAVLAFYRFDDTLVLELENVLVGETKSKVTITISQLQSVLVDDEPFDGELMEYNDGEILTLEITEGTVSAIIFWIGSPIRGTCTRSYKMIGKKVSLTY